MEPEVVNSIVAVAVSLVYSLFKGASWSRSTKEQMAVWLAVGVGLGVAAWQGRTDGLSLAAFPAMAWATMQAFYRAFSEKLGVEEITRHVQEKAVTLVTNGKAPATDPLVQWAAETNRIYKAYQAGAIDLAQAKALAGQLKAKYPGIDLLPPGWPGNP